VRAYKKEETIKADQEVALPKSKLQLPMQVQVQIQVLV